MDITQKNLVDRPKLVITVAITGAVHGKEVNPNLPVTPKEQIQAAYDCYNAGASIVHLHVRDAEGQPTSDLGVYGEVLSGIMDKCPGMITQIGVAQAWRPRDPKYRDTMGSTPPEERLRTVRELLPKPDMWTVGLGSANMMIPRLPHVPPEFNPKDVFLHFPPSYYEKQMEILQERGIEANFEIAHLSFIQILKEVVADGIYRRPLHIELLHGDRWGWNSPDPRNLMHAIALMPEDTCTWSVLGTSYYQLPLTTIAMALGGHIRVGMEDNIYYRRGELCKSNAQLVERSVRIAKELEREIASPQEAREIYKIGK
ncbi:MAG: 3-keto-5-aminohexanoate cleavage protein [candidate division WOR-3 bacterium]